MDSEDVNDARKATNFKSEALKGSALARNHCWGNSQQIELKFLQ
ncbi:MAG: hypothetical protein ABSD89_09545 [Halobacteriota archaeon]